MESSAERVSHETREQSREDKGEDGERKRPPPLRARREAHPQAPPSASLVVPAGGDEQRVGSLGRIIIWLVDAALLDRVLAKSSVIRLQQIEDPFAVLLKMW